RRGKPPGLDELNATPVEYLHSSTSLDEDVFGLQVPVERMVLVGYRYGARYSRRQTQTLLERQAPFARQALAQGFALEHAHLDIKSVFPNPVVFTNEHSAVAWHRAESLVYPSRFLGDVRERHRDPRVDRVPDLYSPCQPETVHGFEDFALTSAPQSSNEAVFSEFLPGFHAHRLPKAQLVTRRRRQTLALADDQSNHCQAAPGRPLPNIEKNYCLEDRTCGYRPLRNQSERNCYTFPR